MSFITIDPGLQGTGIAVFSDDKKILMPEKTAVLHSKPKGLWPVRATEITDKLEEILMEYDTGYDFLSNLKTAYIELPTFFQTAKGASCATGKNGDDSDLVKLSVLIGKFHDRIEYHGIEVVLVPVKDWKGTGLPKNIVIARIAKRLGTPLDKFPNHVADAVGIGLWVKGVFAANTGVENGITKLRPTGTASNKRAR